MFKLLESPKISEQQQDVLADALADRGYFISDHFFLPDVIAGFSERADELDEKDFSVAGVGRSADFQIQTSVRSDTIHWLNKQSSPQLLSSHEQIFLQWMEQVREGLNRRLYLGLKEYECHFARYEPGAFYKKHLDTFRHSVSLGQTNRRVSTVLYLNAEWAVENGGELLLYNRDDQLLETVLPIMGRFIVFMSEEFPHEVLPAKCRRKSIAGWFRAAS